MKILVFFFPHDLFGCLATKWFQVARYECMPHVFCFR